MLVSVRTDQLRKLAIQGSPPPTAGGCGGRPVHRRPRPPPHPVGGRLTIEESADAHHRSTSNHLGCDAQTTADKGEALKRLALAAEGPMRPGRCKHSAGSSLANAYRGFMWGCRPAGVGGGRHGRRPPGPAGGRSCTRRSPAAPAASRP
ncbi:DUF6420 family protein [Streptomyces sp. NRRL F-4474]|uniref:DUF6420 family protein n=1 Tax=Streptomyces sp. NRRL F-4474 TaxID=1463851 RepID=UPI001F261328|nr:DUF6420 family protein [Streptomyces sp. NRRL F-4474]